MNLSEFEIEVKSALESKGYTFRNDFDFECRYHYWKNRIAQKKQDPKYIAHQIDRYEKNIINITNREISTWLRSL